MKPGDRVTVTFEGEVLDRSRLNISEFPGPIVPVRLDEHCWYWVPESACTVIEDPWQDGDVAHYRGEVRYLRGGTWYSADGENCLLLGAPSAVEYTPIIRGGKMVRPVTK